MASVYAQLPKIVAHRGASAYAPENTAAAIKRAAQMGARWCEVDVTISKDGEAVIFHDAELNRCSNGSGLLIQKTLAELKTLDAGSWFSPEFKDEKILTLTELITLANSLKLGLNIEIKPTLGREIETVEAMVRAFAATPPQQSILLSSFNPYALRAAQKLLPQYERALNSEAIPSDWLEKLNELDASGLHFQIDFFDAKQVAQLKQTGFYCMIFTVNQAAQAHELHQAGVDSVFSDHPNLI